MGQKIKMWSNKKIGYMYLDSFGTQISKHEEYNLKLITRLRNGFHCEGCALTIPQLKI